MIDLNSMSAHELHELIQNATEVLRKKDQKTKLEMKHNVVYLKQGSRTKTIQTEADKVAKLQRQLKDALEQLAQIQNRTPEEIENAKRLAEFNKLQTQLKKYGK